ncbi:hypothetical protein IVA79_18050 [Bradyrhizobium sp. 138]|uniref:hypothetical protein n=1 Tax=Bradyrhizobium sp. 138 TaxID=2782615 RepID=UPI001FFA698F|nr:hypothetical protein [Bradyrhizobium sp. 138]MCK1735791.1 hypothetical protein [Bradyrhizobium sp. 138]
MGVQHHSIEGGQNLFASQNHRRLLRSGKHQKAFYDSNTGFAHATRAMKDALKLRKAAPSEIAKYAIDAGIKKKPFSRALRR